MRNSCVSRPAKRRLIIINESDLQFTDGNVCAAALISFFEYWHNVKLDAAQKAREENDIREAHGDDRTQNETLVQFHTMEDLESGLCGMYRKDAIRKSLDYLIELKVIDQFKNPNPRYSFDKTNHFIFHPEVLNTWFDDSERTKPSIDTRKSSNRVTENRQRMTENRQRVTENRQAIPEITSETTSEITEEKNIYSPIGENPLIRAARSTGRTPVERIDRVSLEQQAIWFQEFWNRIPVDGMPKPYWRKVAKTEGKKAFNHWVKTEDRFRKLMEITAQRMPEMLGRKIEGRPYPASWINSEPWEDLGETSPPQTSVATRIVNGANVARPSRKEEAAREFALRVLEASRG